MLIITGAVFLLLALLSGLALLTAPFGGPGGAAINWLTFPLFSLLGPTLFMFSSDNARAAKVCGITGIVLVALGLSGIVTAFLTANGILPASATDISALWYVAGIGLAFGSGAFGLKSLLSRRQADSAQG